MVLRVVFADDNYLVREGVAALLAEVDDIELVDTVADPQSLLKSVASTSPTPCSPTSGCRRRTPPRASTPPSRSAPSTPSIGVVVLSQYVEEDYAFELLEDGVAGLGYLLKERVSQLDELVRALHEVARGGSALDPKVVEGLMARKAGDAESPLLGLTEKERAGAGGDGHRHATTPRSPRPST